MRILNKNTILILFPFIFTLSLFLSNCGEREKTKQPEKETKKVENQEKQIEPKISKEDLKLTIDAENQENNSVKINISSNVPGTIEVSVSLDLANQKDDDPYVGDSKKVVISNKTASVILNDKGDLPSGKYNASVTLYPLWGYKDELSQKYKLDKELSTSKAVTVKGKESAKSYLFKKSSQKWVMENVISGYKWKNAFWTRKFGSYEEIQVTKLNPKIIKGYYFKKIDMTIFVNILKNEVSLYREGKVSE